MPKMTAEEIQALDQMLAFLFDRETINSVNAEAKTDLKPYKKHTPQEIEKLYSAQENDEKTKLARQVSATHQLYNNPPEEYVKAAGKIADDNQLGRTWSYALDSTIGKDDAEKKQIHDKNMKIIADLQTKEGQKKYLEDMKQKMLDADYSLLFTGKEEDALKFAAENPQLCEMGWVAQNDFFKLLDKNGIQFTQQEKEIIEDNILVISGTSSTYSLAEFMSSDLYPLMKDSGYEKTPETLHNYAFGINAPQKNGELMMEYMEDPGKEKVFKEFAALKNYGGQVQLFYQEEKNRELAGTVEEQLRDLIGEKTLTDEEGNHIDPIDYMIQSENFMTYGKNVYSPETNRKTIINDILRGADRVSIRLMGKTEEGKMSKPLDLRVTKDGKLETYSDSAESVKARLLQLRKQLDSTGTLFNASPEYVEMHNALHFITEPSEMETYKTVEDLQGAMKRLVTAANNYYFAKLDQDKNNTRSVRFSAAREIQLMSNALEKNERHHSPEEMSADQVEQMLRTDLINKYQKIRVVNDVDTDSSLTKEQKKQEIAKRCAPKNRKKFYESCRKMIHAVNHPEQQDTSILPGAVKQIRKLMQDKSPEELQELLNMSAFDFRAAAVDAVMNNAAHAEAKQPEEIRQPVDEIKVPQNSKPPVLGG